MGFKANWSEAAQSNSLKPEDDYECLIAKAEERDYTNSKGEEKTCLNISFIIRNDVEQGYKNGHIFHTLWKRREPTENDKQVKGYGFNQVMALGKAAGLPDGKDYDSLEQFLEELIKKPVRVTIKHGEWNGEKREEVSWLNPTKFPTVKHTFKQSQSSTAQTYAQPQQSYAPAQTANQGFVDMPIDDDLPF
nr:MAG: Protein of unknown function (DUF669) [Bacteriophage sp.]